MLGECGNFGYMAGRPALFTDAEQLETAVKEYFDNNAVGIRTVTGLALWLGFESRQSFYDYEKHEQYSYIIKRARLEVENNYEIMLLSKNPTGAIFALKNMGWKDKVETEHSGEIAQRLIVQDAAGCEPLNAGNTGIPGEPTSIQ